LNNRRKQVNETNKRHTHTRFQYLLRKTLLLLFKVLDMSLEDQQKFSRRSLKGGNESGRRALESPQKSGINLGARGQSLELLKLVGAVKLALENGAGEVVVLELLLPLEVPVGLECGGDLLGVNEEPHIHALHAGFQRLPGGSLHGLVHQRVLRHDQLRALRERLPKLLELLHGEPLVVYARQKVAVFQLLPHRLHSFLFLRAGNRRPDTEVPRGRPLGQPAGGHGERVGGPCQNSVAGMGLGLGGGNGEGHRSSGRRFHGGNWGNRAKCFSLSHSGSFALSYHFLHLLSFYFGAPPPNALHQSSFDTWLCFLFVLCFFKITKKKCQL